MRNIHTIIIVRNYSRYVEHENNVRNFLTKCREAGITLNANKFKFAQECVQYVGYIVSKDGVEADPEKIKAIANFPTPKNITALRSFLGLVNQLGQFSSKMSSLCQPLRGLLSKKNEYLWLIEHSNAFEKIKKELCSSPILTQFDPKLPVKLQTDASKLNGLGFALLQQYGEQWKLIQCGSKFLTPTETRYATIELEMLAILWAIKKCRLYLLGLQHFTVATDHRPLQGIMKKSLDEVENVRLQRMKEKLSIYNFTIQWVPGRENSIPDALSRSPVDYPKEADEEAELKINVNTITD